MKVPEDTASKDPKFPFTDTPNDDAIDRASEANHDVDFASVAPIHNYVRPQALSTSALPNPLT